MKNELTIPQGEEKILVELTVKQALALSGSNFKYEPQVMTDARRKLKRSLENKFIPEIDNIH